MYKFCITVGKRNYFTGYGILLHELPVYGCTFQYTKYFKWAVPVTKNLIQKIICYNIYSDLPTWN